MEFVRIGNHILNASLIVDIVDNGEVALDSGKQRSITIRMSSGSPLEVVGAEADAVWASIKNDLVVWSETYTIPKAVSPVSTEGAVVPPA